METLDQEKNANKSASAVKHPSDKNSDLTAAHEPKRSDEREPLVQKSTGPRTIAGKERSKINAVTHGIFSGAIVLKNESQSEYDCLLRELSHAIQPIGMLEDILVEKLATLTWRLRRLLIAERAEIQKGADFLEWDKKEAGMKEALEVSEGNSEASGLVAEIANPFVLEHCLHLLEGLEDEIEQGGFEPESNEEVLSEVYGTSGGVLKNLFDSYSEWSSHADYSDQERKKKGYASRAECVDKFLAALEKEKRRLIQYKEGRTRIESERTRLESLRKYVPDAPEVDRLIRYGSHLERSFDKTLTQLERLQRMRLGQPVVPPIKVDISSS